MMNFVAGQDFSLREKNSASGLGIFTRSYSVSNVEHGKYVKKREHEFILQDQSAKLLPKERVCNCCKKRIDKDKDRTVMYDHDLGKAYWGNVQRCGSLWTCPPCSKKISEKRKLELMKAIEFWKKNNGHILFLTLTSPHSISDRLSDILEGQKIALKYFFGDRKGRDLFFRVGKCHHVRALEVTYGSNGWHPHYHILLFVDRNVDFSSYADSDMLDFASNIYNDFLQHWQNSCRKAGLRIPNKHGLDIKDGRFAWDYVSKFGDEKNWSIEQEMTKGIVKKGRYYSLHPFDLLNLSIDDEEIFGGKFPSKLFQEYAISFKGKRQLMWSKGLKKLVGIDEETDQDIVDKTENNCEKVLDVDDFTFLVLTATKKRHLFLEWIRQDIEDNSFFQDFRYSNSITATRFKDAMIEYIQILPNIESKDIFKLKDYIYRYFD